MRHARCDDVSRGGPHRDPGYPVAMATRQYRFGRFRLNPHARELFDGAERINLPVSTIDTLIHLIEHRDRPVGRDELAAAVWGRADVSEVSLSHAIMRLRRLLGDTGNDQRVIRTVPRLGYRWVMEGTTDESDADATRATDVAARRSAGRRADTDIAGHVLVEAPRAVFARGPRSGCRARGPAARSKQCARLCAFATDAGDGAARDARCAARCGVGPARPDGSRRIALAARRHRDRAERDRRRAVERARWREARDRSRRISGCADRAAGGDVRARRLDRAARDQRCAARAPRRSDRRRSDRGRTQGGRRASDQARTCAAGCRCGRGRRIARAGDAAPARQRGRAVRADRCRARSDTRRSAGLAGDAGNRTEPSQGRILRAATIRAAAKRSGRCSRTCRPIRRRRCARAH